MQENRCPWAKTEHEIAYHDTEWGRPEHRDALLFELLILEGMQAGLSWNLVLRKRARMAQVFDGFDPVRIAAYGEDKLAALMQDAGIIRNRRKLDALVGNARAFLDVQREFGSFDAFIWGFSGGKQLDNRLTDAAQMPASNELSAKVSQALVRRGFRFVGPTICYSYLQAIGMVNDHLLTCPLHDAVQAPE